MHTGINMIEITERLNQIYDKVTDHDFLECKGLGNEIAFYIFDYMPEEELIVRNYIDMVLQVLFRLMCINLNPAQLVPRIAWEESKS